MRIEGEGNRDSDVHVPTDSTPVKVMVPEPAPLEDSKPKLTSMFNVTV